jgi:hypothetical protein
LTSQNADDAIYSMQSDKNLKNVKVKDIKNKSTFPCYYMDMTQEEANKLKEKLQAELEEKAKPEIEKRAELKKKTANAAKERRERKTTKK